MGKKESIQNLSCTDCTIYNCRSKSKEFPGFCLTTKDNEGHSIADDIEEIKQHLQGDDQDAIVARASAQVEGIFYGKLTRVEEVIEFANRIGAKKIGIATCAGLIEEAKIFANILEANGLEYYSAICKVGAVDKTEIGVQEEHKLRPGNFEAMCNPILQARILNYQKTDLNVIIGLCVGHDSLFIKYSDALVTALVVKDRVTGHNPVAALYTAHSYHKRLLQKKEI
ncbi:DUF1847 domain-containing protein [Sporomusa sp. KB1]|jgi:uncharacterized metal-binding protein|uniref:DUF1847 domain-containing protein n=1 Tax=Sporomusa sp. KB1 TaxID=943346 RepID=UPI0011A23DC1|nr:DUF1847 domain-containing protein [Sporomusa sp. KB1]TWH47556.1 putative metal-binding protein [Sporomusa sp. KB1]